MKRMTIFASALAFGAAPALAGSPAPVPADPPVVAPAPVATTPNWTGFYGGVQLGYGEVDTNVSDSDDGVIGGITAGYDYDLGNVVLGAGLDYDVTNIDVANATADLESLFRAKLRAGYKIGQGMIYGTGGYAMADTDTLGSEDGYFVGAGWEHRVTDQFGLGGEVLYHGFDSYGSTNIDVEATTVQLRGIYRF